MKIKYKKYIAELGLKDPQGRWPLYSFFIIVKGHNLLKAG